MKALVMRSRAPLLRRQPSIALSLCFAVQLALSSLACKQTQQEPAASPPEAAILTSGYVDMGSGKAWTLEIYGDGTAIVEDFPSLLTGVAPEQYRVVELRSCRLTEQELAPWQQKLERYRNRPPAAPPDHDRGTSAIFLTDVVHAREYELTAWSQSKDLGSDANVGVQLVELAQTCRTRARVHVAGDRRALTDVVGHSVGGVGRGLLVHRAATAGDRNEEFRLFVTESGTAYLRARCPSKLASVATIDCAGRSQLESIELESLLETVDKVGALADVEPQATALGEAVKQNHAIHVRGALLFSGASRELPSGPIDAVFRQSCTITHTRPVPVTGRDPYARPRSGCTRAK